MDYYQQTALLVSLFSNNKLHISCLFLNTHDVNNFAYSSKRPTNISRDPSTERLRASRLSLKSLTGIDS